MQALTNEMLLALRNPKSGWLATMICALEEALKDPDFSAAHREMIMQIVQRGEVSDAVYVAAEGRLAHFEASVAETAAVAGTATQATRPKLVLVSNAA